MMKANCRRIEAAESHGVAQVIQKETRLMRYALKGQSLDSQSSLFRRAITCSFRRAHYSLNLVFGLCTLIFVRVERPRSSFTWTKNKVQRPEIRTHYYFQPL